MAWASGWRTGRGSLLLWLHPVLSSGIVALKLPASPPGTGLLPARRSAPPSVAGTLHSRLRHGFPLQRETKLCGPWTLNADAMHVAPLAALSAAGSSRLPMPCPALRGHKPHTGTTQRCHSGYNGPDLPSAAASSLVPMCHLLKLQSPWPT